MLVQRFMVASAEWFVPRMTRSQQSTQIRWADSDSRIRRRRDRPGFGRPFWWREGSDREPQPRIVHLRHLFSGPIEGLRDQFVL